MLPTLLQWVRSRPQRFAALGSPNRTTIAKLMQQGGGGLSRGGGDWLSPDWGYEDGFVLFICFLLLSYIASAYDIGSK